MMPSHTTTSKQTDRHHQRRYSWPTSLHLIDVSKIPVPLPDIDDDPFAHFVSSPSAEDDLDQYLDALAFSAGIFIPHQVGLVNKEKAHKFGISIARRWKQFMGRRHSSIGGWNQGSDCGVELTRPLGASNVVDHSNMEMGSTPNRPSRSISKRSDSKRSNKWARHSWHAGAPSMDLYTIEEEDAEGRCAAIPMLETE